MQIRQREDDVCWDLEKHMGCTPWTLHQEYRDLKDLKYTNIYKLAGDFIEAFCVYPTPRNCFETYRSAIVFLNLFTESIETWSDKWPACLGTSSYYSGAGAAFTYINSRFNYPIL